MPHRNAVVINRAPVLTLWAAIVAERLGFDEDASLTLGRAVAVLNARSKGRKLGIFKPKEKEPAQARPLAPGKMSHVEVCGRTVLARQTEQGLRAVLGGKVVRPDGVRQSLNRAFGEDLDRVRSALRKLARSCEPAELKREAYSLYERFRPAVPAGMKGWGAKGELDLNLIRRLARRRHLQTPMR